jgi:agmatinase
MSNSDRTPVPTNSVLCFHVLLAPRFARLPELRDVPHCDVAIVGIPFDSGDQLSSWCRFGPRPYAKLQTPSHSYLHHMTPSLL